MYFCSVNTVSKFLHKFGKKNLKTSKMIFCFTSQAVDKIFNGKKIYQIQ